MKRELDYKFIENIKRELIPITSKESYEMAIESCSKFRTVWEDSLIYQALMGICYYQKTINFLEKESKENKND